jgi:hypothetical protein
MRAATFHWAGAPTGRHAAHRRSDRPASTPLARRRPARVRSGEDSPGQSAQAVDPPCTCWSGAPHIDTQEPGAVNPNDRPYSGPSRARQNNAARPIVDAVTACHGATWTADLRRTWYRNGIVMPQLVAERDQRRRVELAQAGSQLIDHALALPDQILVCPSQHLDGFHVGTVRRHQTGEVPISAHHIGQHPGVGHGRLAAALTVVDPGSGRPPSG